MVRLAFLIPSSTEKEPRRAAGVRRTFPQYLALCSMMGLRFHSPRNRGLISGLPDTFLHSVPIGSGVHPSLS